MNLESPDATVELNLSPELAEELRKLEKKRKLAVNRYWFFAVFPILIALTWTVSVLFNFNLDGLLEILALVYVLFTGALVFLILPTIDSVSIQFKKMILPKLIDKASIAGEYRSSNNLEVRSFLNSGLYQESYSRVERFDGIVGKYKGMPFGLYEIIAGTKRVSQSTYDTNLFYGWALHVPIRKMNGKTYIIPYARKTKEECDDWLKATGEFIFQKSEGKQIYTGDDEFDKTFGICSTNETEAKALLQAPFRHFLMEVHRLLPGAAAYSFIESRAYMHCGINGNSFDLQRGQVVYPAQTEVLVKRLRLFCAMVLALHTSAENAKA